MKRKITDDIFKDSVQELFPEESISKVSFDINMAASTLLGYAVGNQAGKSIGEAKIKDKMTKSHLRNSKIPSLEGDYYSQVENISSKIKVLFTPISVVYILDNKGKDVTLEVIEKSEMNEVMLDAYSDKNDVFFKNLIINKIKLDVQNAEQIFVKKMLDANKDLHSAVNKTASESATDLLTDLNTINAIQNNISKYPENTISRYFEKIAFSTDDISVSFELERPISSYCELGNKDISIFKIAKATKDEVTQDKLLNKKYVNSKIKIGFLADRVTFMIDDMIIGQLHVVAMSEDGYENFKKKNTAYFKQLFSNEVEQSEIIKTASEVTSIKDIFYNSLVHPKVYYLLLNSKFGNEWISYDPEVLIKLIETEFELMEPIYGRALDKILSIQNICSSNDCLTNDFVFEKMVRALNHKTISFSDWEYNVSPGEIINALQIIDELTPTNDIFDDLSEKVVAYISKAFVLGDCRAIIPSKQIISSELEQRFFEILNSDLNQRWSSLNKNELYYQRYIQPLSSAVVKFIRNTGKLDSKSIEFALNSFASKSSITDERIINLSRDTAIINLSIDIMIKDWDNDLRETRTLLNL